MLVGVLEGLILEKNLISILKSNKINGLWLIIQGKSKSYYQAVQTVRFFDLATIIQLAEFQILMLILCDQVLMSLLIWALMSSFIIKFVLMVGHDPRIFKLRALPHHTNQAQCYVSAFSVKITFDPHAIIKSSINPIGVGVKLPEIIVPKYREKYCFGFQWGYACQWP